MEKCTYKTDRELRALKPAEKWYDVRDEQSRNLIVRVGPLNSKGGFRRSFCLVTRFPGSSNPVRHAFGEYGELSLEDARNLADEWRGKIRKGIDPREEQRQARQKAELNREAAEQQRKLSFGAVIDAYLTRHVKRQRRAAQVEREIRRELIPLWKDKLVTEIGRSDVVTLVQDVADRPAPYQARNVYGHIQTFFNWAIEQDRYGLDVSPCDRLKPARIIGEKRPRQRVLNDVELVALWRAAGHLAYPYGPLMRMLLVTGQRKSEVAEARWSEFDLPKQTWTVPPERFKSNSSHIVPLTGDALAILDTLPRFKGPRTGDCLFTTTNGAMPVNGFSRAKERLDRFMLRSLKAMARKRGDDPTKVTLPNFVLHDIRRTVRTRLSSLRISERVAEMVIGHGKKGLARVYDQHEFADEMREALELWAGRLRSIVRPSPANVVTLDRLMA